MTPCKAHCYNVSRRRIKTQRVRECLRLAASTFPACKRFAGSRQLQVAQAARDEARFGVREQDLTAAAERAEQRAAVAMHALEATRPRVASRFDLCIGMECALDSFRVFDSAL